MANKYGKKFNLGKDQRNRKDIRKKRKTNVSTMAINVSKMEEKYTL